jgi:REP element-mobilizing transposase RayT
MPRRPRVSAPGLLHHVTDHGIDARPLFADDADRWRFIAVLSDVTREVDWRCLGFCLMETHYHLIVEEGHVPLSKAMRLLNGRYVTEYNRRHGRRGHLFEARYRDKLILTEEHLIAAVRYLARNPLEVGACVRAEDWPWGTYGQMVGATKGWSFVSTAWFLALFSPRRERAIEMVREYVEPVPGT